MGFEGVYTSLYTNQSREPIGVEPDIGTKIYGNVPTADDSIDNGLPRTVTVLLCPQQLSFPRRTDSADDPVDENLLRMHRTQYLRNDAAPLSRGCRHKRARDLIQRLLRFLPARMRVQSPRNRLVQPRLLHQRQELASVLRRADALNTERVERVPEHEVVPAGADFRREPLAGDVVGEREGAPVEGADAEVRLQLVREVLKPCPSFSANSSSGPSFSIISTETGRGTVKGA